MPLAAGVSDEASGIVASSGTPGAYFLIDDGTGDGVRDISAVSTEGQLIARIGVDGMSGVDPEALAAGGCGPSPAPGGSAANRCLYIGDIGDNNAVRDGIAIFRVAEPDLTAGPSMSVAADEWRYRYPDGPRNAEALLVQPDGTLLVVTKPAATGAAPHRMYLAAPGGGELQFVREFSPPAPQRPLRTLFAGNVVTDLGSGPGRVLLLTYDEAQEYVAPNSAAPLSSFPDWPHHRLLMPALPQAEGITPMILGCGYAIASEAGPGGRHGWLSTISCH